MWRQGGNISIVLLHHRFGSLREAGGDGGAARGMVTGSQAYRRAKWRDRDGFRYWHINAGDFARHSNHGDCVSLGIAFSFSLQR